MKKHILVFLFLLTPLQAFAVKPGEAVFVRSQNYRAATVVYIDPLSGRVGLEFTDGSSGVAYSNNLAIKSNKDRRTSAERNATLNATPTINCEYIFENKQSKEWHQCIGIQHGRDYSDCNELTNPLEKDACVAALVAQDSITGCDEIANPYNSKDNIQLCHLLKSKNNFDAYGRKQKLPDSILNSSEYEAFERGCRSDIAHDLELLRTVSLLKDPPADLSRPIDFQKIHQNLQEAKESEPDLNYFLLCIAYSMILHDSEKVAQPLIDLKKEADESADNIELLDDYKRLQALIDSFLDLESKPTPNYCLYDVFNEHGVTRLRTGTSGESLKKILKSGYLLSLSDADPENRPRTGYNTALFFTLYSDGEKPNKSGWQTENAILLDPKALDLDPNSFITRGTRAGRYEIQNSSATKNDLRRFRKHVINLKETNGPRFHELTIRSRISLDYAKEIIIDKNTYESIKEAPELKEAFNKYRSKFIDSEGRHVDDAHFLDF